MRLDVRDDFPVTRTMLESPVTGERRRLIYMDHAASTHPPTPVLDEHERFVRQAYANVHRGAHHLSVVSTEAFEDARWKVEAFVGAPRQSRVVFTQNTTGALNLAAHFEAKREGATLVTLLEHHSNDLPHRARGPVVHVGVTPGGDVDLREYERKLRDRKVKLVAVTAASNVTGIRPPLKEMIEAAHDCGARVLVDGAQALAHVPLDLSRLSDDGGPDYFAAAGHKAYAPFGAAFLVARADAVDEAPPFFPGGGTVKLVSTEDVAWTEGVERHEGGTPNVPGVVALGAALDYLRGLGMERIRAHELELLERLLYGLRAIPGVTVYGDAPLARRVGVCTFNVAGVPHSLVSTILDHEFGIATRNGCFCAHPYLTHLLRIEDVPAMWGHVAHGGSTRDPEFPGAVRASIGVYNLEEDVEALLEAVAAIAKRGWRGQYEHVPAQGWVAKPGAA